MESKKFEKHLEKIFEEHIKAINEVLLEDEEKDIKIDKYMINVINVKNLDVYELKQCTKINIGNFCIMRMPNVSGRIVVKLYEIKLAKGSYSTSIQTVINLSKDNRFSNSKFVEKLSGYNLHLSDQDLLDLIKYVYLINSSSWLL